MYNVSFQSYFQIKFYLCDHEYFCSIFKLVLLRITKSIVLCKKYNDQSPFIKAYEFSNKQFSNIIIQFVQDRLAVIFINMFRVYCCGVIQLTIAMYILNDISHSRCDMWLVSRIKAICVIIVINAGPTFIARINFNHGTDK